MENLYLQIREAKSYAIFLQMILMVTPNHGGRTVVERWSNGGRTVVERWSNGGRTVVERWSNGGRTVVERWSNGGRTVVERWSNGGRTVLLCVSGLLLRKYGILGPF